MTVAPKPAVSAMPGAAAAPGAGYRRELQSRRSGARRLRPYRRRLPRPSVYGPSNSPGPASSAVRTSMPSALPAAPSAASAPAVAPSAAASAPSAGTPVAPGATAGTPSAVATAVPGAAPATLTTPEAALAQARASLAAGHAQATVDALDRFMALAPAALPRPVRATRLFCCTARPSRSTARPRTSSGRTTIIKSCATTIPKARSGIKPTVRASYIERHYFDIR